jgi:hypothetical protein
MLSQLKLQIKLDPPPCNKMQKAAELVTPVRTMGEYHRQGV